MVHMQGPESGTSGRSSSGHGPFSVSPSAQPSQRARHEFEYVSPVATAHTGANSMVHMQGLESGRGP